MEQAFLKRTKEKTFRDGRDRLAKARRQPFIMGVVMNWVFVPFHLVPNMLANICLSQNFKSKY